LERPFLVSLGSFTFNTNFYAMNEVCAFVSFSPGDYYQPAKKSLVTVLKDFIEARGN